MTRRDALPHVPDWVLERYRLGELPEGEARALEERLRDDPQLREGLEALERSDAEIRRQYPPAWLADRIRRRLPAEAAVARPARPAWSRRWPVPVALAAAAGLMLVLSPRLVSPPTAGPGRTPPLAAVEPGDRIKGLQPSLQLYRKTSEGSETLADGAITRAGDLIRVGYRAAGSGFGAILSIDGRGGVTVHLPVRGDQAAALERGETVLLNHAYQLDDAPGFERFYFVTSKEPFALAPVVNAARQAAATPATAELSLGASFGQSIFLLRKGARP